MPNFHFLRNAVRLAVLLCGIAILVPVLRRKTTQRKYVACFTWSVPAFAMNYNMAAREFWCSISTTGTNSSDASRRLPAPWTSRTTSRGYVAIAITQRLYFTMRSKLYCLELSTNKPLWEKTLPHGTDRMSITPDGKTLYVPSFEGDTWNVVDAASGEVITSIETKSSAHNTVVARDGKHMYLGGLRSPILFVADTATHKIVQQGGPFAGAIRPFTVNLDSSRAFICVNDLLGFEIGDLTTGKKLARVEVQGFEKGNVARHGCPSHGIGLTPDEREIWVADAHNKRLHVFDNTVNPPKQGESILLRDEPGWITFTIDGKYAYPSTGEVIDTSTKKIVTVLVDEKKQDVASEKMLEIDFQGDAAVAVGDQFGVGRR